MAIIGEIGSGKTSLVSALIGDMIHVDNNTFNQFKDYEIVDPRYIEDEKEREKMLNYNHQIFYKFHQARRRAVLGTQVYVRGSMCLMEQTPWVLNATIRDNICFGEPLDPDKYNRTIELCQLARDLDILEGGDLTQIGEKGINLSGGQKARIGIARSVYADKDIVFMDSPFAALDAHVKRKIFDEVCLEALRGKTRILVTHSVDFLDRVDKIIVMEKGEILHQGTFEELKDLEYFRTILDHMKKEDQVEEEEAKHEEEIGHNDLQNNPAYSNEVRK